MPSLLSEFTRDLKSTYRVVVMDEAGLEAPRSYTVRPRDLWLAWTGVTLALTVIVTMLVVLTPIRELIPGYSTAAMQRDARLNALRLAAVQDSLEAQQSYVAQLRSLMMGQIDSARIGAARAPEPALTGGGEQADPVGEPTSRNWTDHLQPALPVARMPAGAAEDVPVRRATVDGRYLSSLQFPVLPPVGGFFTRGFEARTGHYGIDLAVEEGTVVRSVGEGYVVFADWSHEGGYALVVQHADGYMSVYKHNQRLLKRVGDRVRARDAIAMSGNSGETTTGPHLHFELWYNGLAQDPRDYFIGS